MTSADKNTKTIKSLVLFFNAIFFVSLRAHMHGHIFTTILNEFQLFYHKIGGECNEILELFSRF